MENFFYQKLVAHRGYPHGFPENCLAGIGAALEAGALYIEVDIQLSKDEIPVVFHDRDLKRLCDRDGAIHQYNWQEIKQFTVNSPNSRQQTSASIASLEQLLELIKTYPDATFFIELKRISVQQFGVNKMLLQVHEQLKSVMQQCILISYSIDALKHIRQHFSYQIGLVMDSWDEITNELIAELNPEYIFCDIETLPSNQNLSKGDAKLAVYECIDPNQAMEVMSRGVDLVETFAIIEMAEAMAGND